MALKLSPKQTILLIIIGAVAIVVGTAVALFFLLEPAEITTSDSTQAVAINNDDLGGISAKKIVTNIQKTIPTITAAYSYDAGHDPESLFGKADGYTAGFSFYDTRTGEQPTGNYTAQAGGSIEVFKTDVLAAKRLNSLRTTRSSTDVTIGATNQISRYVVRASTKLDAKAQSAVIAALSDQTMTLLSNLNDTPNDKDPTVN